MKMYDFTKKPIELTCQRCGDKFMFYYSGRGKKAMYCAGCLKERHRLQAKKYNRRYRAKKNKKEYTPADLRSELYLAVQKLEARNVISKWRAKRIIQKINKKY